jgi:hypothetical protein
MLPTRRSEAVAYRLPDIKCRRPEGQLGSGGKVEIRPMGASTGVANHR